MSKNIFGVQIHFKMLRDVEMLLELQEATFLY